VLVTRSHAALHYFGCSKVKDLAFGYLMDGLSLNVLLLTIVQCAYVILVQICSPVSTPSSAIACARLQTFYFTLLLILCCIPAHYHTYTMQLLNKKCNGAPVAARAGRTQRVSARVVRVQAAAAAETATKLKTTRSDEVRPGT
jgi:hypothetical protein